MDLQGPMGRASRPLARLQMAGLPTFEDEVPGWG